MLLIFKHIQMTFVELWLNVENLQSLRFLRLQVPERSNWKAVLGEHARKTVKTQEAVKRKKWMTVGRNVQKVQKHGSGS